MISRRIFAISGLSLFLGATISPTLLGCSEENTETKNLKNLISKKNFGIVIDEKALPRFAEKSDRYEKELIKEIFGTQTQYPKTTEEVIQHLHKKAVSDFASGNTVLLDGWVFSKTTLNFAILQSLL